MESLVQRQEKIGNALVVHVAGQVTFEKAPEFHQELLDICETRPTHLVIDLTGVTYIDSSGVGTLTDILRKVNRIESKLSLAGMNKMVRGIFEITRLDRVFSIFSTTDEALQA